MHSAPRLALQSLGNTIPEIVSMIDTIQSMSHTASTSYGDSNLTYRGDTIPSNFMHFVMVFFQGNGSAPKFGRL